MTIGLFQPKSPFRLIPGRVVGRVDASTVGCSPPLLRFLAHRQPSKLEYRDGPHPRRVRGLRGKREKPERAATAERKSRRPDAFSYPMGYLNRGQRRKREFPGQPQSRFATLRNRTVSPSFLPWALLGAGRAAVLKTELPRSGLALSLSRGEASVSKTLASG